MWKCKKCGEELEDSFDTCWQCGTPDDGSSPRLSSTSENKPGSPTTSSRSERSSSSSSAAVKRYSDAYLVARTIAGIGGLVKTIAIFIGGGILILALVALTQDNKAYGLFGLVIAVVVTVPIYVLGVLVAAQGQTLKATLDTAVHSSPFLKKEEMAKVMSL